MADAAPGSAHQTEDRTDYAGIAELWAIEKCLRAYNRSVVGLLSRHFPTDARMLEFGAGIGTLAQLWTDAGRPAPECLEIDATLRATLRDRGFVCHASIEDVAGPYDGLYSSNVLEHIEDDIAALRRMRSLLAPGAPAAIYVPAFKLLYSEFDAAVGHYRRYGKRELTRKLQDAGFDIVEARYVDSAGFFAALAMRIVGHKEGASVANEKSFAAYDRYVYPVSRLVDSLGARRLFGKNLLVVARNAG